MSEQATNETMQAALKALIEQNKAQSQILTELLAYLTTPTPKTEEKVVDSFSSPQWWDEQAGVPVRIKAESGVPYEAEGFIPTHISFETAWKALKPSFGEPQTLRFSIIDEESNEEIASALIDPDERCTEIRFQETTLKVHFGFKALAGRMNFLLERQPEFQGGDSPYGYADDRFLGLLKASFRHDPYDLLTRFHENTRAVVMTSVDCWEDFGREIFEEHNSDSLLDGIIQYATFAERIQEHNEGHYEGVFYLPVSCGHSEYFLRFPSL